MSEYYNGAPRYRQGVGMGYAPTYQPAVPMPSRERDEYAARIADLERRLADAQRYDGYYYQPQGQPSAQQTDYPQQRTALPMVELIPVESAADAWRYKSDETYTGKKQWFINVALGEIYSKQFDATIPDVVRETYRKTAAASPDNEYYREPESQQAPSPQTLQEPESDSFDFEAFVPLIKDFSERVDIIADKLSAMPTIDEIKGILDEYQRDAASSVEVDNRAKPANSGTSKRSAKSSDADRGE